MSNRQEWILDTAFELGLSPNDFWRVLGIKQFNAWEMVNGKRDVPKWLPATISLMVLTNKEAPKTLELHINQRLARTSAR